MTINSSDRKMSEDNSQVNSRVFSIRIVSIDWYMVPPIPKFDICYSSFQGGKVNEVPVIRIYGSTPAGQKTCLHVHRAFPYLYVPCSDVPLHANQEGDSYTNAIALALEKALKLKGNAGSKRQHVHGCNLVRARKFYGYHSSEELFVKIYFYYPHDVSRAASLLLGGAVFNKCLQPHEAHIPFILQFLIEYNLYGMGHAHLSKIKFRDPVPAAPRRFSCNWQNGSVVENLTCTSAEIKAGLGTGESLDHPVWTSSTIPGEWMWHFSSEFEVLSDQDTHPTKRQSICELEGDAAVDDILNQQCKIYTSLSQSSSEAKMVHSLVPIWQELSERIGLHEATVPPDPGKPHAKDVLRTLLHGLEFEKELAEFCGKSKENLPLVENSVKFQTSSSSLIDEENFVEDGNINFGSSNEELLKSSTEKDVGSSALPLSQFEEEVGTKSGGRKDELVSADGIVSFGKFESLEPKDADMEALGLLRWLATSQAAEDINSDDELVRETILSPLLPITIDKVLEKANMDYESESQKECQDILDSIEDFPDIEGLKEKTCNSIAHGIHGGSSSKIAEGDALFSSNVRSSGYLSKVETKDEFKRDFKHLILQTSCSTSEHKRKTLLWGSLPFTVIQKENDELQARGSLQAEAHGCEVKICRPKLVSGDVGGCSDASIENASPGVCEVDDLFGSSVRDLMRRKRCRRVALLDCSHDGAKTFCSQEHKLDDKLVFKDVNATDKGLLQKECTGFYSLSGSLIEHGMLARDDPQCKSVSSGEHIPSENPKGMDVSADTTILQNEDCGVIPFRGDSQFFVHDTSVSSSGFIEGGSENLISMSFSKKPPLAATVNWKDGTFERTSFSRAPSCHLSIVDKENQYGSSGNELDELLPFFEEDCREKKVVQNNSLPNNSSDVQQEAIIGVTTHYQNDGSLLYLLTPVHSPPSAGSVYRWLECNKEDANRETNKQSMGPLLIEGLHDSSCVNAKDIPIELHSISHTTPIEDQLPQKSLDFHPDCDQLQGKLHCEKNNARPVVCGDCPIDLSQISGPSERSRSTPLSQIGFQDPASTGAGQQLAVLSIEIQAETRGDLKPDPRFDAIKVISLAFQNDNDSIVDVHVLLHGNEESYARNSDGLSVSKVSYFSEESHLFNHFIRIIGFSDPDILMGWDVQGGSLGFLAERAANLGIGLLNKISRTPLEIDKGAREREISEKGVFDAVLDESLAKELPLVDETTIEDEWGRTHASGIHVGGRIVLNIWRLMRNEVKLNMYTIEAACEAVLRRKIPSIPDKVLTKWFSSGPGRARYRCIEYMVQRAKLNLEIMNQIDMINRTSELARVFGIDFFSVLSRGSQYRVESMLLRLAHTQNYLAISPGNQQVASQPAMECLPLVMEPESGFYADPVLVLDFQSLYPSMIIAYNLCFCTCVGNVSRYKANILGVSSFSPDPHVLGDLKDEILLTPNGVMYVPPKVRKGVLPRLLEEILSTRIMVKQAIKKLAPTQQVLHRIFNARQLALKLIANVTYGYTAAGFSGRMPCAELADSIVQCGRRTLENAISLVNANDKWNARVIYGDTDSMFVLLKGRTIEESFQIGREIASAVSAMSPDPVTLKFEKVYHPCFLLTKKRYVGYSYESADQIEPVFDAKGIETVRRDTCGVVAKMMERSLRLFFEHQDISEIKGYLQRQWTRILSSRVSLEDFIFAKEVRLGTYSKGAASSLPPAAIVATKAMRADPRAEPRYAERVPYVVIHGEPGARLVDMVVDPMDLLALDSPYRLNDIYYINKQIIPALQRIFGLVGADLNQWFLEMPRPSRDAFAKRPSYVSNPQRTRIDYYYLSKHCVLCDELVHASTHICDKCSENETAAATAVIGRTSKLEREMQHLAAICRHCGGGDWVVESGVKCTSLACSVFYERRKLQKELRSLSTVATDKGLYPKCMVEWF